MRGAGTQSPEGRGEHQSVSRCPGHEVKGHGLQGPTGQDWLSWSTVTTQQVRSDLLTSRDSEYTRRVLLNSFYPGHIELPSVVKIREKKDTRMLGGVRPVERLMKGEM